MRFSSKPVMGSSELYYYGYRFYDPSSQRWLNRDPLGEVDTTSLYAFVGCDPIGRNDSFGLWQFTIFGGVELGGYVSFGYNSGQFNFSLRGGGGFGAAISFDASDSGRQAPGFAGAMGIAGAVGAGFLGAGGEAGVNGQGLYSNVACRIGHQALGVNAGVAIPGNGTATPWAEPMLGVSNFGAAFFYGGGFTWATDPEDAHNLSTQ
jgi:RHS repeat-associated protein